MSGASKEERTSMRDLPTVPCSSSRSRWIIRKYVHNAKWTFVRGNNFISLPLLFDMHRTVLFNFPIVFISCSETEWNVVVYNDKSIEIWSEFPFSSSFLHWRYCDKWKMPTIVITNFLEKPSDDFSTLCALWDERNCSSHCSEAHDGK